MKYKKYTGDRKVKIILTGAAGTGKTTLNKALQPILEQEYDNLEIIDSMSEKFFKKEDFEDLNSDRYLQAQKNIYEYAKNQYLADRNILSSRGFADSYAYIKHSYDKTFKKEFQDLIKENFENNKKLMLSSRVYTFYIPIEFEIEGKELRSTNKEFQKETDRNIKEFLDGTRTIYTTVTGSVKQRVKQVLKVLGIDASKYKDLINEI